jgi:hypothetical protein
VRLAVVVYVAEAELELAIRLPPPQRAEVVIVFLAGGQK